MNLTSAVTLDTGTILNTSASNSSMNFTSTIEVDLLTIEATNITLTNITCSASGYSPVNDLFWDGENANIDSKFYCNSTAFLKLNENSGSIAHDVSGNANNGVITGATWQTDTILITLTNLVDYSVSKQTFTLLNPTYAWDYILASYQGNAISGTFEIVDETKEWIGVIIIMLIIPLFLIVFKSNNRYV